MYILALSVQQGRQPFQATFRVGEDVNSAAHAVITDYLEGFDELHAFRKQSCGIEVYRKLQRKRSEKLLVLAMLVSWWCGGGKSLL
jgi:hypothetical protein